jgi:hypothetical protein
MKTSIKLAILLIAFLAFTKAHSQEENEQEWPEQEGREQERPEQERPEQEGPEQNEKPEHQPICKGRDKEGCFRFKNCVYNQVVPVTYSDYGCSVCERDYQLQEDVNTSWVCIRSDEPRNCLIKAINALTHGGKPFCYECERGYFLSEDGLTCKRLPKHKHFRLVRNCESYVKKDKKISCSGCKKGYTLTEKGKCKKGCQIEGCKNCQIIKGKHYCITCDRGTIGVYDVQIELYLECLTCNTWQCRLLTEEAQQCCRRGEEEHEDNEEDEGKEEYEDNDYKPQEQEKPEKPQKPQEQEKPEKPQKPQEQEKPGKPVKQQRY